MSLLISVGLGVPRDSIIHQPHQIIIIIIFLGFFPSLLFKLATDFNPSSCHHRHCGHRKPPSSLTIVVAPLGRCPPCTAAAFLHGRSTLFVFPFYRHHDVATASVAVVVWFLVRTSPSPPQLCTFLDPHCMPLSLSSAAVSSLDLRCFGSPTCHLGLSSPIHTVVVSPLPVPAPRICLPNCAQQPPSCSIFSHSSF